MVSEQIVSAVKFWRSKNEINPKYIWHLRFDHIEEDRINKLKRYELPGSSTLESFSNYGFYLQGKMTKPPFMGYGVRTTNILMLIHSDVYSPFDELVKIDSLYFITYIGDCSQYRYMCETQI